MSEDFDSLENRWGDKIEKNERYYELVKSEAIAKVKSNRRNREVEIVLSETHLSLNFIGTGWRVKSKRFQTFNLDRITLDFNKGSKGYWVDIPAKLSINKPRRDGDPYFSGDRWSIMFNFKQNDELEEFIKLFELSKIRAIKSIKIEKNERHYELVKSEAIERERTKDYDGAVKRWEKLGAYDEVLRVRKVVARERESARDYDAAIEMWEEVGDIEEAARVRKLKAEEGSVKVSQKVVHGDNITKTKIKDSVLNRSKIGSGGSSKAEELREAKTLLDDGIIDDDEFKQMKKEILGK